eukprot:3202830-Pleurochrysis_carterae.AAC.1
MLAEAAADAGANAATFMRANSALTDALVRYCGRPPARRALVAMLAPPLRRLAEQSARLKLSLEMEPCRVTHAHIEHGA